LQYRLTQTTGPDHAKVFQIELTVQNEVLGTGEGRSKKEAEEAAARAALVKLTEQDKQQAAQQQ